MSIRCCIFYLLFAVSACYAGAEDQKNRDRAISTIQKATLSYPIVKGYTKNVERELFELLPLSRQHAGIVGSFATVAISGKVNTTKIKRLNINLMGGNLRPDIVYDFRTRETSGLVFINWGW